MRCFKTTVTVAVLVFTSLLGHGFSQAHPDKAPSYPRVAQEGESCNGSLPPRFAVVCDHGLYCRTAGGLLGASGTCVKAEEEPEEPEVAAGGGEKGQQLAALEPDHLPKPAVAQKGEKCNGSLPPQFAVICAGDLVCAPTSSPVGGWGRCVEAHEIGQTSLSSSRVNEPEKVGSVLPFMLLTFACISIVFGITLRRYYDFHFSTDRPDQAVGEHYLLIA